MLYIHNQSVCHDRISIRRRRSCHMFQCSGGQRFNQFGHRGREQSGLKMYIKRLCKFLSCYSSLNCFCELHYVCLSTDQNVMSVCAHPGDHPFASGEMSQSPSNTTNELDINYKKSLLCKTLKPVLFILLL